MLNSNETEMALTNGSVAFALNRDLIVACGEDAASFLNGQLSQAVLPIPVDESRWSLLLDPQGKVVAWLRISRRGDDEFWLDSDVGTGEAIVERLNRFKLRTKIEFSLSSPLCYAVRGDRLPPRPEATDLQLSVDIGWRGTGGFDVIGPDVAQPAATQPGLSEPGATDVGLNQLGSPEVLEALRIRDGVPQMGHEFRRATIAAETGVIDISVDFTKGCYTGQELITRVHSRGSNTPRKVHRVYIKDPEGLVGSVLSDADADTDTDTEAVQNSETTSEASSEVDTRVELLLDGATAGQITSWSRWQGNIVALASIKRGSDLAAQATVVTRQGPVAAVVDPHYVLEQTER